MQIDGVIAELAMGAPGSVGQAIDLAMDRQATLGADKAKGGLRLQPGEPLGGIELEGEPALLGTEHHILPVTARLDQREDVGWLGRRGGLGRGRARRGCLYRRRSD